MIGMTGMIGMIGGMIGMIGVIGMIGAVIGLAGGHDRRGKMREEREGGKREKYLIFNEARSLVDSREAGVPVARWQAGARRGVRHCKCV